MTAPEQGGEYVSLLRVPTGVKTNPDTGINEGFAHADIEVKIDPDLEPLGQIFTNTFGPPRTIVLREPNDQVLLHELLHLLLDGVAPKTQFDPNGHQFIAQIEVALWETGWRRHEPVIAEYATLTRWNVQLPNGDLWFAHGVGETVARDLQDKLGRGAVVRWTRTTTETLTEVPLDRPDTKVAAANERVARRAELRAEAAAEGMNLPKDYRANLAAQFAQGEAEARRIVRANMGLLPGDPS